MHSNPLFRMASVALLLYLSVLPAHGAVLRCVINGHTVYTNLYNHCPPQVAPKRAAKKSAVKKAVQRKGRPDVKREASPKRVAKRAPKVKPHLPRNPMVWWNLLGGSLAPAGVAIKATHQLQWQGVTIRYAQASQLLLAKRLLAPDRSGIFLPQLADRPIAARSLQTLAKMRMERLTVVPYDASLFVSLRKDRLAQVPAPVAMMEVAYRDQQGKERVHELPFGEVFGVPYVSIPYPVGGAR